MALICFSLMTHEVKHLFLCLLAIGMDSWKVLVFIELSNLLICKSLYILDTLPVYCKYHLPCCVCWLPFTFSNGPKFLILMKSSVSTACLYGLVLFVPRLRNLCLPRVMKLVLVFPSGSFTVWAFPFGPRPISNAFSRVAQGGRHS